MKWNHFIHLISNVFSKQNNLNSNRQNKNTKINQCNLGPDPAAINQQKELIASLPVSEIRMTQMLSIRNLFDCNQFVASENDQVNSDKNNIYQRSMAFVLMQTQSNFPGQDSCFVLRDLKMIVTVNTLKAFKETFFYKIFKATRFHARYLKQ